jgi:hypothetical protein
MGTSCNHCMIDSICWQRQFDAPSVGDRHRIRGRWDVRRGEATMGQQQATEAMAHAQALAVVTVLDLEDRPQLLGQLWSHRPAVLVFLRHFG